MFADKVMKAAMKHIEIIANAREKGESADGVAAPRYVWRHPFLWSSSAKNAEALEAAALEEYGSSLHAALYSRKNELLYLRRLTEMLFPYVMPPKATDCRYRSWRRWQVQTVGSSCNVSCSAQVSGSAAAGGDVWIRHPADHGLHGRPRKHRRLRCTFWFRRRRGHNGCFCCSLRTP